MGHSKVVCLTQTNNDTWDGMDYEQILVNGSASNGTVTFSCWFLVTQATADQWFQFMCLNGPGGASACDLQVWHEWIAAAHDDGAGMTQLIQYQLNAWYYVRAIVNFTSQTYSAWINGTQYVTNAAFNHASQNVPYVNDWHVVECIQTDTGTGQFYVDSFLVENGTDNSTMQFTNTPAPSPTPTTPDNFLITIIIVVVTLSVFLIGAFIAAALRSRQTQAKTGTNPVTPQPKPAMQQPKPLPKASTPPSKPVTPPVPFVSSRHISTKSPQGTAIVCPRCGLIVEATNKFCEYCGASLEEKKDNGK
jgi:hypothetical protein